MANIKRDNYETMTRDQLIQLLRSAKQDAEQVSQLKDTLKMTQTYLYERTQTLRLKNQLVEKLQAELKLYKEGKSNLGPIQNGVGSSHNQEFNRGVTQDGLVSNGSHQFTDQQRELHLEYEAELLRQIEELEESQLSLYNHYRAVKEELIHTNSGANDLLDQLQWVARVINHQKTQRDTRSVDAR